MIEQEKRKCRYPGAQKSYFQKGAPGNARWTAGPAQPCWEFIGNGIVEVLIAQFGKHGLFRQDLRAPETKCGKCGNKK